ncbi:MAG: HTH-type transcriptional repressor NemR [Candidatus Celerinatantimonas neptuna]|nr:MAG: HTH-type transcriptional repressor NemR [Candidatus Celerinatantimonas neptuna]
MNQSKNVRQHILDTAEAIISHKGFSAVGLNEILKAAGTPKGSFYHYFSSKEAFGAALLEYYFQRYIQELESLLNAPDINPKDALMQYWYKWYETQSCQTIQNKCLVVKLAAEVCDLSEDMRHVLQRGVQSAIETLTHTIERTEVVQSSSNSALLAKKLAEGLYQLWLGASLHAKIMHNDQPLEAALETTRTWLNIDLHETSPSG